MCVKNLAIVAHKSSREVLFLGSMGGSEPCVNRSKCRCGRSPAQSAGSSLSGALLEGAFCAPTAAAGRVSWSGRNGWTRRRRCGRTALRFRSPSRPEPQAAARRMETFRPRWTGRSWTCITHAIDKPKSRAKTPASARLSDRFLGRSTFPKGAPVVLARPRGRSPDRDAQTRASTRPAACPPPAMRTEPGGQRRGMRGCGWGGARRGGARA